MRKARSSASGRNSYLSGHYCELQDPENMISEFLEREMQRSHCTLKCSTERDTFYDPTLYKSGVDVFHSKMAFDKWKIPTLKKELGCNDENLVSQALCTLIDLSYNPEKCVQIIGHNVIERLGNLVTSDSPFIRQKVAVLLRCIASNIDGCSSIAQNRYLLERILVGMVDEIINVRFEYIKTMFTLIASDLILTEIRSVKCMETLVERLHTESHEPTLNIVVLAIEHLAHSTEEARKQLIELNAFEQLHKLLQMENWTSETRCHLVGAVLQILKHKDAKNKCNEEVMNLLLDLLFSSQASSSQLFINVFRALTFATISTQNKLSFIQNPRTYDVIEKLVELAGHNADLVRLSAIQFLTIIAEIKRGRAYLQNKLEDIQLIAKETNDKIDVHKAVRVLIQVIQKKPFVC